jgi:aspartate ammonia-lyase
VSFLAKGEEFKHILKVGRTQLQDAVPMTLGQEFHGYATTLGEDIARLRETIKLLSEVNLGGTAVGTGITADPGYSSAVVRHLSEIAGWPLEIAGYPKGRYDIVHPIDDVNRSQSTNDTYPTALKLAMTASLTTMLYELDQLRIAFGRKGREFSDVLKVGRTQLQDAVPMTLGQEFNGFAHTIAEDYDRLSETIPWLNEINMGATAIGTGITADPRYADAVRRHLVDITGIEMVTSPDLIEATSDAGIFMTLSGHLKRAAVKLSKICNDLRLLSSGPQAGIGEINLPVRQAGSSIMPGKVNPVIPEVVNQVAFSIIGADATVTAAAEAGQLQLNAFEPVIAHSILQSLAWMTNACYTLRVHCIDGITANTTRLAAQVESSVGVVTALTPYIGYAASATLAHTALTTNASIAELVVEAGLMTAEDVARVLSPERLSGLAPVTGVIDIVAEAAPGI